MDIITHGQLRALVDAGAPPCVSIFMPTHRAGSEIRQDPIEFKNLLKDAEEQLVARGLRHTVAIDFLEPARRLLDDPSVWANNGEGLAVFISDGFFRGYRLPVAPEPSAVVNHKFQVKGLLPLLTDKLFYVVAVSQHAARLLECTQHSCQEKTLPEDVAKSLMEAIQGEDEHQTATVRHGGGGTHQAASGASVFHGEAVNFGRSQHEDVKFYFRQLDDGVLRTMADTEVPVVLAGDVNITPTYREASRIKNIVEETIHGNPENTPDGTLHQKALEILEPMWHDALNQEQETFGTALAQQRASRNVEEILAAAMDGRVATLFVAPGETQLGHLNEERREIRLHDVEREDSEDLIDAAARLTIRNSGRVVVVHREEVPGDGPVAAIYRY